MKSTMKQICIRGLMIALVAVATTVIQIPMVATQGYVNLGDGVILLCSILLGAKEGMIAGGLGSALADILTGYPNWSIFSLLIKGGMGWMAGRLGHTSGQKIVSFRIICVGIFTEAVMVAGYFLAGALLYGSFAVSAFSIWGNAIQGVFALLIYHAVAFGLMKSKVLNNILQGE